VLLEGGRPSDALALLADPSRRIRDALAARGLRISALQGLGRHEEALAAIRWALRVC
jgi:hypothetical protein